MMPKFFFAEHCYIFFLLAIFLIIPLLFFYHRHYFREMLGLLGRKAWVLLSALLIFASVLRFLAIPHDHYVFYDEFHYMNVAQNMYYHGFDGYTLKGDKLNPQVVSRDIRPGGYSFLITLFMTVFGDHGYVPFYMNSFLGVLSVGLVFLIVFFIFYNTGAAFWAALLFCLMPLHLKYSGSGSSDVASLFFVLAAALTAALYYRRRKRGLLFLLSSAIVVGCYVKPENLLLYLLFVPAVFVEYRRGHIKAKELFSLIYFSLILLLPMILQMPLMLQAERNAAQGPFWSFRNYGGAFRDNIIYIASARYNLVPVFIFFLYGSAELFYRRRKIFYLLTGWFLAFFLMYPGFFLGNFLPEKTLDAERHFLTCAAAYCVLAGYGISRMLYIVRSKIKAAASMLAAVLGIVLVLNSAYALKCSSGFVNGLKQVKEKRFIREAGRFLPYDTYILDYCPAYIISGFDRKAVAPEVLLSEKSLPEKLILLKGFWWHAYSGRSADMETLLDGAYDSEVLASKDMGHGNIYRLEILRKKHGLDKKHF